MNFCTCILCRLHAILACIVFLRLHCLLRLHFNVTLSPSACILVIIRFAVIIYLILNNRYEKKQFISTHNSNSRTSLIGTNCDQGLFRLPNVCMKWNFMEDTVIEYITLKTAMKAPSPHSLLPSAQLVSPSPAIPAYLYNNVAML